MDRARAVRVARRFSQGDLARRSGLGIATIQRFQRNGHTSLANVVRIAFALGVEDGLERLFEARQRVGRLAITDRRIHLECSSRPDSSYRRCGYRSALASSSAIPACSAV